MTVVDRLNRVSDLLAMPMPMKRDTTPATEVQRTSGFIAIKTVPGLHLAVNEKSQKRYTQQATKKRST